MSDNILVTIALIIIVSIIIGCGALGGLLMGTLGSIIGLAASIIGFVVLLNWLAYR